MWTARQAALIGQVLSQAFFFLDVKLHFLTYDNTVHPLLAD